MSSAVPLTATTDRTFLGWPCVGIQKPHLQLGISRRTGWYSSRWQIKSSFFYALSLEPRFEYRPTGKEENHSSDTSLWKYAFCLWENSWCMSEQPANPICERSACITPTAPPPIQHLSANCRGFVPPGPWAAAPAAARDTRLCSLAALQAGPAAPPPQHPRGTANQAHHAPAKHLSGVGFFRPSPLSSGLLLNLLILGRMKKEAPC